MVEEAEEETIEVVAAEATEEADPAPVPQQAATQPQPEVAAEVAEMEVVEEAPDTQITLLRPSVTSIGDSERGRGTVPTVMDALGETTRALVRDTIETSFQKPK